MIIERCESGTYLLRNVPIDGKYIPTQASKTKKDAISDARFIVDETVNVAIDIAIDAINNIILVDVSNGINDFANFPNIVEPHKQDAMKQENTAPYGVA
mmetsp:Transcript_37377/g.42724  ORF Transcript_37377/g.42724 Transcript_37377/m.42724 type:complete len:99 (-) Transcript_37377:1279-1575(-)